MARFKRLFGRKHAPQVSDPVFGDLTCEGGIWTKILETGDFEFLISIVAPESGPSPTQRSFFQEFIARRSSTIQQAIDFVQRHAHEADSDIDNLTIYSLEIGEDEEVASGRFVLELTDADQIIIHRVTFESGYAR